MSGGCKYVDLHVHTAYSIRDGVSKISDLIGRTKLLGRNALAITDHGNLSGTMEFYNECKKRGIKPILGCEVYVAATDRFDRKNSKDNMCYHLTLLAKNNDGWKNLCNLSSKSFIEGFYGQPRIDIELLKEYRYGIIALSGCSGGEVINKLLSEGYDEAKETARKFKNIFDEDFYLEVQRHGTPVENAATEDLKKLGGELNIKLVATNNVHYAIKEEACAQNVMKCMREGVQKRNADKCVLCNGACYIKSDEEMLELFADIPQALENSVKIADACNVTLKFEQCKLPAFHNNDKDSKTMLRKLAEEGLKQKYSEITEEVQQRLEYELQVICDRGFEDYFLIVREYIKYVKDLGYLVGPGRGSAVGSLISYLLGITAVDPLKHNLIFERFLNPGRKTLPDIDVDFEPEARDKVFEHLKELYGEEKVCKVVTFSMLGARQIIRDLSKCLKVNGETTCKILECVDNKVEYIRDLFKVKDKKFLELYNKDAEVKRIADLAVKLEGNPRQTSTHASAVIISDKSVQNYIPLEKRDDKIMSQFTFDNCEKIGLLKLDLLSLNYLTIIRNTMNLEGLEVNIEKIPMDDENVYEFLASGNTYGIFQMESKGMTEVIRKMRPRNLQELAAGISLYRPGPMNMIDEYIEKKDSADRIEYTHPDLKPVLEETFGCIVYQEQVMQICTRLAGYTLAEADVFRQIIKKKNVDEAKEEKAKFINGCIKKGIEKTVAEDIFKKIVKFAEYAFNKSHAVSYAMITYVTAYLKYYYSASYMATIMEAKYGSSEKFEKCVSEIKRLGIKLNPPDVNKSRVKFSTLNNEIFYGLSDILNVGEKLADAIVNERQKGEFSGLRNFVDRLSDKITKNSLQSLIMAGAFDFCGTRLSHIIAYEKLLKNTQNGLISEDNEDKTNYEKEFPEDLIKMLEKKLLKIPITQFSKNSKDGLFKTTELLNSKTLNKEYVHLNGIVEDVKVKLDRYNKNMSIFYLKDDFGKIRVSVFSEEFKKFGKYIYNGRKISLYGYLNIHAVYGNSLVADSLEIYKDNSIDDNYSVYIKVDKCDDSMIYKISQIILDFYGNSEVHLIINKENQRAVMNNKIAICKASIDRLSDLLGAENVFVYKKL